MRSDTLELWKTSSARTAHPLSLRDECEWLIDNSAAYDRVLRSIGDAKRSVWITQLAIDPDCLAFGSADAPDVNIAESLVDAAESRGVEVRILMNQTLLLDTVKPFQKWLGARAADKIRIRGMQRFPQLLHAKMVVVDEHELFLIGSPFVNGYWDDSRHLPADLRRPDRELGGRPLHDVSVRLTGSVVRDAITTFSEWWRQAIPDKPDAKDDRVDPSPVSNHKRSAVQLATTSPSCRSRRGRTDILDACLDGISRARSLIYIEHQYLSARPIVHALNSALDRHRKLEVIIVLNQNPDVTAYRRWQNQRLSASGLLVHPRVGVFSLWSTEQENGRIAAASQVFVHSKVIIVDDAWTTVGSANLDGVSLHSYGDDFAGPLARSVFRNVRNFDVNAVVRDTTIDGRMTTNVSFLRTRLWAEHLGVNAGAMKTRPAEGWLQLWRKQADRNVIALDLNDSRHRFRGFVLPYSTRTTPAKQWADLGVHKHAGSPELKFNPGWAEVYLSPNWVRNMFL